MGAFGLGPAFPRLAKAPSHRFAWLACALLQTVASSGCNIGHNAPELAPDNRRDDTEDNDTENDDSNDSRNDTDDDSNDTSSDDDAGFTSISADAGDDAGTSSIEGCSKDAYRCVQSGSPERELCDDGVWVKAPPCGRGLVCEVANASTTTCVAVATMCDGGPCGSPCQVGSISCEYVEGAPDVALSCSNGTTVRNVCNGDTPHCVNQEGCKACSQNAHCSVEPPACQRYACNDEFQCELEALGEGQMCTGGVCSGEAQCVQCNVMEDCGTPSLCHHFSCNDHVCQLDLDNERSSCVSDAGSLCNAVGACVECLTVNDCASQAVAECHQVACLEGACSQVPAPELTPCAPEQPQVCDGQGECVECLTSDQCGDGMVCHDRECESSSVYLGWYDDTIETYTIVYPVYLYLLRVEPLQYPAVLESFGQIAQNDTNEAIRFALYEDNGRGTGPEGAPLTTLTVEGFPEGYQANPAPQNPALQPGVYHWLAFRVSAEVELRYGSETDLVYGTGAQLAREESFADPFYEAGGEDLTFGFDNTPLGVFAIVRSTQ